MLEPLAEMIGACPCATRVRRWQRACHPTPARSDEESKLCTCNPVLVDAVVVYDTIDVTTSHDKVLAHQTPIQERYTQLWCASACSNLTLSKETTIPYQVGTV